GWPLSVFMTAEGKPFFAGTYFPRHSRMGMPGFVDLLHHLGRLWRDDRQKLLQAGDQVTSLLQGMKVQSSPFETADTMLLEKAFQQLQESYDRRHGGFGFSPKFPTVHNLTFLLRWYRRGGDRQALEMVEKTLEGMRKGGMFDQLGFGFHRYSVDEKWLVPHFEKMLYDQAMLLMVYTEAWQLTGKTFYSQDVNEIVDYLAGSMTAPEGAFYAAEDADSEGEEGRFYVWTSTEIKEHLGVETGDLFCRYFNITAAGNFEKGTSIPHLTTSLAVFAEAEQRSEEDVKSQLEKARKILLGIRDQRVHPLKDDKIITSWNGLMIAALAKAGRAFNQPEFIRRAVQAADFLLARLQRPDGGLWRRFRQGEAGHHGCLDDYAFLVWGLTELFNATHESRWLEEALKLTGRMNELFWDESGGRFFFTASDTEQLLVRPVEQVDGAIPAGNSVAAYILLYLGRLTGNPELEERGDRAVNAGLSGAKTHPEACTHLLSALDFLLGPGKELVIAGSGDDPVAKEMLDIAQSQFQPTLVTIFCPSGKQKDDLARLIPFLQTLPAGNGQTRAYLCEQFACQAAITDTDELRRALEH
ncbi:MAG: thioredoxin domain-containing protein, partial [Pseudomonadota bacterium]|nr:thioredoxin domain-containing protein [Pseudomonadota bacterium]